MGLRMMNFDYEIVHRPGKWNIADYLSRHPIKSDDKNELEKDTESYVSFVSEHAIPKSVSREVLLDETNKDEVLCKLKTKLNGDILSQEDSIATKPFDRVFSEISVTSDGLVLRGKRIVIPDALIDSVLKIAHEGHLGIVKTKSLIRTKIWFPDMDKRVEKLIEACLACQLEGKGSCEPIKSTNMPCAAWEHLCMDFFGPLPNGNELMVVMDEFSRLPVVEEIKTTASEHVIPALDSIFSLLGIPVKLKTDNGPPFNGHKFKEFSEYMGFKHQKITPEAPQSNGQAENFMKNLGKVIRSAKTERREWKFELNKFLRNYRSSPHSTTGKAPSILMFNRNNTSRLPRLGEVESQPEVQAIRDRDHKMKQNAKIYTDKRRRARTVIFDLGEEVFAKQKITQRFNNT